MNIGFVYTLLFCSFLYAQTVSIRSVATDAIIDDVIIAYDQESEILSHGTFQLSDFFSFRFIRISSYRISIEKAIDIVN